MGTEGFRFVFLRGDADRLRTECEMRTYNLWFYRICSIMLLISSAICAWLPTTKFGAVLTDSLTGMVYLAAAFLLILAFVSCGVASYNQRKTNESSAELNDGYITGSQFSATYR